RNAVRWGVPTTVRNARVKRPLSFFVAAWTMTLAVAATAWAQAQRELPKAVYSRQASFPIPFRVEGGQTPGIKGEVQLYLSEDRGGSWKLAGRAPLAGTQFDFRAPRDGEYWF